MSKFPHVLTSLLVLFVSANNALAERGFDSDKLKGPVDITADRIEQHKDKDTAIAKGKVVIEYRDSILTGEECFLDNNTGLGIMENDVQLRLKDIEIQGERMDFDIDTGLGTVIDAKGFSRLGHNFSAKKAERVEKNRYYFENGVFSTCDPNDRDWYFKSSSTDLWVENIAVFKHARFHFKGVPLFYSPVWAAPATTKRKTGFLQPGFGYSTRDGDYLSLEYFIALSEQDDITLYLDPMSYRGMRKGFEYRYAFAKKTAGQLNLDHIDDRKFGAQLWRADWTHRHQFKNGVDNRVKVEEESELSYSKYFFRKVELESKRYTDSYIEFSKSFEDKHASVSTRRFKELKRDEDNAYDIFSKYPEISGDLLPREYFGAPVAFSLKTLATSFVLETKSGTLWNSSGSKAAGKLLEIDRFHIRPKVAMPITPHNSFNVMPWIEGRSTWYSRPGNNWKSFKDRKESFSADYYTAGVDMEPPKLFRIFKIGENLVKHSITPQIGYQYTPGYEVEREDRTKAPALDDLDSSTPTNLITMSIINRVLGKRGENSVGRDLLTLTITQNYDINELKRKIKSSDTGTARENRPYSNMTIDLDSRPTDWLLFNNNISYNHYDKRTDSMQTEFGVRFLNGIYASYDRFYTRASKDISQQGLIGYEVAKGLSVETSAIYDEKRNKFPATMYLLEYKSCCYSLTFSSTGREMYKTEDGRAVSYWDTHYELLFNLKGFGEKGKEISRLVGRKI